MKALLVVDVQNDFCPGGNLAVRDGDAVVADINHVRGQYPLVLFTQDWHPKNHQSFASQHPGKKPGEVIELHGLSQILWPDHCVQGTWGAQLHPKLVRKPNEAIFYKGTDPTLDSYSAFYDNAHRKSTGLADHLRRSGVKAIDIAGLATDYCVKFSALDALAEGFSVTVLASACRAVDLAPGDGEKALAEIRAKGGQVA